MVYGPFLYKGKAKGMFIPFTQSCQAGKRIYLKNKKAGSKFTPGFQDYNPNGI